MNKSERKAFEEHLFTLASDFTIKSKECLLEGCESKTKCRNLCSIHYRHMNRAFGPMLNHRDQDLYVGVLPPYAKRPPHCIGDDNTCQLRAVQRGLCTPHWSKYKTANGMNRRPNLKTIDPEDLWEYIKQQGTLNK